MCVIFISRGKKNRNKTEISQAYQKNKDELLKSTGMMAIIMETANLPRSTVRTILTGTIGRASTATVDLGTPA